VDTLPYMTRIAIALPHRRCTSSWGWATTRRPVPNSLAGRGTSRGEALSAEGELARSLGPSYQRCVPLAGNRVRTPSPSAIVILPR
jgi:hypothetical protein